METAPWVGGVSQSGLKSATPPRPSLKRKKSKVRPDEGALQLFPHCESVCIPVAG
jgi:hypothetical protein